MDNYNNLTNKARKIQEAANGLGWNIDIPTLIDRVKALDEGLVKEDEFIYLLNWSEKCSLINKLDQLHIPPNAKDLFTIPDILVVFREEKLRYFIEIKTSKDNKLSWTEKYYQGLINYSNSTGIPVLVAWKWSSFDAWTLFELKHFKKSVSNYKIDLETAYVENLMSKLAGDYFVAPYEEIALNFKFKKDKAIEITETEATWQLLCEAIYLTGDNGKEINEFANGLLAYLFSFPSEELLLETETHFIIKISPSPNKSAFAQTVPIRLAKAFANSNEINWLERIKDQDFPVKYDTLLSGLKTSIDLELIRNILFLKPKSDP